MPSLLVDPTTLGLFSRVDLSPYTPGYLQTTCAVAHAIVAEYLDFDPAVQVHTAEWGEANLVKTGRDAYQIMFRVRHRPLADTRPGQAAAVFAALSMVYAAPFPQQDIIANGAIQTIVARPTTGLIYVPYLGSGGLSAQMFSYGSGMTPITGPTGYVATYSAGYTITAADAAAYPYALAVPIEMQRACAMVTEALLGQGQRVGTDVQNALTGRLAGFNNLDYSERYAEIKASPALVTARTRILFGTAQGDMIRELLDPYRRDSASRVMLI